MPRPSPQTERVMTLFNLLAAEPGAGLTAAEIARRLGVNKATCYPMLAALHDAGYLVRHPTRRSYHLGPALVAVGRAAAVGLPAADLVRGVLVELSRALRLTCVAIARADDHVLVLDQAWVGDRGAPTLGIGQRLPLRPPWGAVFVAWSDDAEVERWLARATADAGDGERWRTVLAAVRAMGGVVEVDDLPPEQVRARAASLPPDASRAELHAFVERLVEELARQREPVLTAIDPERAYPVRSVNVPVLDAEGRAVLALAAMGFAGPVPGAEAMRILERLRAVAGGL